MEFNKTNREYFSSTYGYTVKISRRVNERNGRSTSVKMELPFQTYTEMEVCRTVRVLTTERKSGAEKSQEIRLGFTTTH